MNGTFRSSCRVWLVTPGRRLLLNVNYFHMCVTVEGVWFANWIYWALTDRNYKLSLIHTFQEFTTALTKSSQCAMSSPVSSAPVLSSLRHWLSLLSALCLRQCPLLPCSVHYNNHEIFSDRYVFASVLCSRAQFPMALTKSSQSAVSSPVSSAPVLTSTTHFLLFRLSPQDSTELCWLDLPTIPGHGQNTRSREYTSTQFVCSRMLSSGMLRRVALVRTDVSEDISASFIRVTIGELGTTLAVSSNRRTLRRNICDGC
jgi:hypothetical protein